MNWAKGKRTLLAVIGILAIGTTALIISVVSRLEPNQQQILADGSLLVLKRMLAGCDIQIVHGTRMAKLLGNAIPSNGVHLLKLNLNRRTTESFGWLGKSWLVAEFNLTGPKASAHPLVKPAFYRQFRFVLYGEKGIEFVQELWRDQFRFYPDGYYGYVVTSRFPRDSHWIGCRVERRENVAQGGPWEKVADFKLKNPTRPSIEPWVAASVPNTQSCGGLELVLEEVTVKTIPYMPRDIWNHIVTMPTQVVSNGVVLTNWSATYLRAEDASGNWDLASHRSLDPK